VNQKRKEAIEMACHEIKRRSAMLDKIEFVFEERNDTVAVSFADNKVTVNAKLIGERCARQRVGHNQMDGFIFWLLERNVVSIVENKPFQIDLNGVQIQQDLNKATQAEKPAGIKQ
jgi:hypothetical protein